MSEPKWPPGTPTIDELYAMVIALAASVNRLEAAIIRINDNAADEDTSRGVLDLVNQSQSNLQVVADIFIEIRSR